ncbi:hypothetical protein F6X40_17235 [Paraburkholderia sp. UCT31]|uniref:hypothetical protein n=1 Tax=Paraburkholderia sp. UCT31 TaxID=2615209 RepID=UPI0016559197|nr:hypothetical protein [Paraburkholderia sp. UCT31]MBC8738519.1 hypothetical protein [Paraburkholderia sp. UCT31]
MRILSKFRDYYDGGLSHGHDDSISFFRETALFCDGAEGADKLPEYASFLAHLPASWTVYRRGIEEVVLRPFIVAFCGKMYPGIEGWTRAASGAYGTAFIYRPDELSAFMKNHDLAGAQADGDEKRSKTQGLFFAFLDKGVSSSLTDFFVGRREAVVVAHHYGSGSAQAVTLNAQLKSFEFFRVLDPFQAFQELSMFFGNILAPESRPMVSIEDKYRIAQAGFDKRSFRKAPSKR